MYITLVSINIKCFLISHNYYAYKKTQSWIRNIEMDKKYIKYNIDVLVRINSNFLIVYKVE